MTAAAVRPKAGAVPVKTAGKQAPAPVPPRPPAAPSRRRGFTPLTPMRRDAAKSMRKLAGSLEQSHPEMTVHQHVRDAAKTLEAGNEEAAQRHLRAAMYSLSPQSIYRHGITTDDGHIQARQALHGVHRHLLLVKDITDVAAKNQAAIRRDSYGDYESGPSQPPSPVRADPNAGYGPGALAQKPTARQPGGDRALNAPARTNSGGSDPAVADPVGPQPRGSKQFARTWDEVCAVLDLAAWGRALDEERGEASQKAHDTASATAKRDWTARRDAASLHGRQVLGRTAQGNQVRGTYDHDAGQVLDKSGGRTAVTHVRPAAQVTPAPLPASVPSSLPGNIFAGDAGGIGLSWDDLAAVVLEMSAETGRLAVTPAPYGKPGGPGLYGVAGQKHSDYFEQVVQALMRKRGMSKGQASAIAWGALRKWQRGGGHAHSEVRAAATGALAEEKVAQARAHAHAVTWDDHALVVELVATGRGYSVECDPLVCHRAATVHLHGRGDHRRPVVVAGLPGSGIAVRARAAAVREGPGRIPAVFARGRYALGSDPVGASAVHGCAVTWDDLASVIELASEAWRTELRGHDGKWTTAGLAELRKLSPAEKRAYTKSGALPDRFFKSASAEKAHEAASAAASRDAKAKIAARNAVAGAANVHPVLGTRAELEHHMAEMHGGNPTAGRKVGPQKMTAAQVRARHEEMHAKGQLGVAHSHDGEPQGKAPGKAPPLEEQRRLTGMWTRAFRYSNRTQGTMRDAQFTNELHRLLSTGKPPSKMTPGAQDAHDFLKMADQMAGKQPDLHRGLSLSPDQAKKMFAPGKTVDMPLGSWGKDSRTAEAFAGEGGVVLHMAAGGKGLDLSPIEKGGGEELEYRAKLQEVVTGGRFTVQSVTTQNGVTHVNLGPQEAFSAH